MGISESQPNVEIRQSSHLDLCFRIAVLHAGNRARGIDPLVPQERTEGTLASGAVAEMTKRRRDLRKGSRP